MHAIWRVIVRTVFWSYERGTWPYDIAVAAIVLFVMLSPYVIHFNDQPQVGPTPHATRIEPISEDSAQRTRTYRLDAALLVSARPKPEIALETHDILRKNVSELKDGRFEVVQIDPIREDDGAVLYYAVTVKK